MALIGIEALTESSRERALKLAERWRVPVIEDSKAVPGKGVKVVLDDLRLGLGFADPRRGKPYFVDFLTNASRARLQAGLPKSHIFRRALGFQDKPLRVIDATAGFGQDSLMALSLRCDVVAVERSSVVAAVLQDGVMRALKEAENVRSILENLCVVEADSVEFLRQVEPAHVVYLDPMFVKPKKSARSPKEMQLLQELLDAASGPDEEERLFQVAFESAIDRVVVKRPLKAKAIARPPTHSFKGQSIRYDVYVKS